MIMPKQDIDKITFNFIKELQITRLGKILEGFKNKRLKSGLINFFLSANMYNKGEYDSEIFNNYLSIKYYKAYWYTVKYMKKNLLEDSLEDYCIHMVSLINKDMKDKEVRDFIKYLIEEIKKEKYIEGCVL